MSTSPTSGAFPIVLGPSPSIAATMCLVTAFFDPRTEMSPRSGPDGSTCHVSVTQTTVGGGPRRRGRPARLRPGERSEPVFVVVLQRHARGQGVAGVRVERGRG